MKTSTVQHALYMEGVPAETIKAFIENFEANPDVWKAFESYALLAMSKQVQLGAKAIMERVRWEIAIEKSQEFKVNNNFTSYYSRVFELKYPKCEGYFETRKIRGLEVSV